MNNIEVILDALVHEIRGPLSVAFGRVNFAKESNDLDYIKRNLDKASSNADRTIELLKKIVVLSDNSEFNELIKKENLEYDEILEFLKRNLA